MVSGGLFHGLQLWVNLPRANKWLEPKYQDLRAGESALLTTHDGGALLRVIAGEVAGHTGPGSTFTPMTMIHATVAPGADGPAALAARLQRAGLRAVRARARSAPSGGRCAPARPRSTARATRSPWPPPTQQESRLAGLDVIVLGGRPIREPVAWAGPFVMNTKAEVLQAFEDYQRGKLGVIPAELRAARLGRRARVSDVPRSSTSRSGTGSRSRSTGGGPGWPPTGCAPGGSPSRTPRSTTRTAGQGLGGVLVRAALDRARERGLAVLPQCPFVRGWIAKHPDYADLVRSRARREPQPPPRTVAAARHRPSGRSHRLHHL